MRAAAQTTALSGALLVALYTALMSGADGITKFIAGQFEAPQLYAISGLIVVAVPRSADPLPTREHAVSKRHSRHHYSLRHMSELISDPI